MNRESIQEAVSEVLKEAAQESMHATIPLYESCKGKQAHGSKTWQF